MLCPLNSRNVDGESCLPSCSSHLHVIRLSHVVFRREKVNRFRTRRSNQVDMCRTSVHFDMFEFPLARPLLFHQHLSASKYCNRISDSIIADRPTLNSEVVRAQETRFPKFVQFLVSCPQLLWNVCSPCSLLKKRPPQVILKIIAMVRYSRDIVCQVNTIICRPKLLPPPPIS